MIITIPTSDLKEVIRLIKEYNIKHAPFRKVADGYAIDFVDETMHSYMILKFT